PPEMAGPVCRSSRSLQAPLCRLEPGIELLDLLFRFFAGDAIALLQLAGKLFHIALSGLQIIVREFAPVRLDLAAKLLPFAFELIVVHVHLQMIIGQKYYFVFSPEWSTSCTPS